MDCYPVTKLKRVQGQLVGLDEVAFFVRPICLKEPIWVGPLVSVERLEHLNGKDVRMINEAMKIADGLARFYGTPESGLAHFTLHSELDIDHGSSTHGLIRKWAVTDEQRRAGGKLQTRFLSKWKIAARASLVALIRSGLSKPDYLELGPRG